jgi:coenzyme F420-reducing hydrogenase alpha subunit
VTEKITISPITRLEGHGKIEIFLDYKGNVDDAYWQVVELRGFESLLKLWMTFSALSQHLPPS